MKFLSSLLLLLGFILLQPVQAQKSILQPGGASLGTDEVDAIVEKLMDTAGVTGLSLAVINNNHAVYEKTYGYKNLADKTLIDTATSFYAASLAKPLFGYILMQLVDEKKIDLDKPLYTYLPKPLPEYTDYKDLAGDDRWKLITARHCLSHTTGLPNWRWLNPDGNNKLKLFFKPGSRYAYSGEGLFLLQMVVEAITKTPLETLAQKRIFKPFGMRRTSFVWQPAFETDYALGYLDGEPLKKNKRTKANAAGSMETTLADYTRFMQAVMQGRLVSKKTYDQIFMPQVRIYSKHQFPSLNNDTTSENRAIGLAYGLGWGLFNSPYGKAFFKEGHDDGWVHYTIAFPAKKAALLIMCNSSNGESIFKELVEKLAGVTIPWEWEGYFPYRSTVQLPADSLQQFVGTYSNQNLAATVTLEAGHLRVVSEKAGLPKTNLYAESEHHFFIKIIKADFEFLMGKSGLVEKLVVVADGDSFELSKVR